MDWTFKATLWQNGEEEKKKAADLSALVHVHKEEVFLFKSNQDKYTEEKEYRATNKVKRRKMDKNVSSLERILPCLSFCISVEVQEQ